MAIVGCTFRQAFIELEGNIRTSIIQDILESHLRSALEMFDAIPLDVVVGSYGFLQLIANDHAGPFRGGSTREQHDACSSVWKCGLQQPYSNTERNASATESTLIIGNWPRVTCKSLQNARQLELALLHRQQEPRRAKRLLRHGLSRTGGSACLRTQTEHILNLFWLIFLASAEDVRFGAFRITKFMYLRLSQEINDIGELASESRLTMVP